MSILYSSNSGFYISHPKFTQQCYNNVPDRGAVKSFALKPSIFKILNPFATVNVKNRHKKRKLKEIQCEMKDLDNCLLEEISNVRKRYEVLYSELEKQDLFDSDETSKEDKNSEALNAAETIYHQTGLSPISDALGENNDQPTVRLINDQPYLFPENCKFYCKNVSQLNEHLGDAKYDLIVLDPPWWNKYIRRKKAKTPHGYKMMYNSDFKDLPIRQLLNDRGLVAVWCTNSQQNLETLLMEVFDEWGVTFVAKWYWMKITVSGQPVCPFLHPPGKQPFEQIVFAAKDVKRYEDLTQADGKIVASVPSALHSHKPPLQELLQTFVPKDAKCLEIFSRYLLPNWTSFGLETLRFQHSCLYETVE